MRKKPIITVKNELVCPIYFYPEANFELQNHLNRRKSSKIFVLVDENTQQFCLPTFLQTLQTESPVEIIEIDAGEEYKSLKTCQGVWNALTDLGADRNSLLINLGGGVITDLGGFVASVFKRGIDFIHVPTTLLAMVDAAIGGKTGVDLDALKNQIGLFSLPKLTLINVNYLATLPQNQLKTGLAEMLKHGLIYRRSYWEKLKDLSKLTSDDFPQLIKESIAIKTEIVEKDPTEKNLRKILNFGHTFGHAIESYFLSDQHKPTLLHGESVAIGIILESYLSMEICSLSEKDFNEIASTISQTFSKIELKEKDFEAIINLLKHDKKNTSGKVNFVLLEAVGKPRIDCAATHEQLLAALRYYCE